MENLEQKAVELLDKLDSLATQYTPDVINAASSAVSITAMGNILTGFFGLGCIWLVWWITKNFATYARRKAEDEGWMSDWDIGWFLILGIGGVTSTVFALASIPNLFNIWNWVAIVNPKLALAHRILGL